jgi:drug/metabolite transporter (DMT)-like permease
MTLKSQGCLGILLTALCWGITDPLLKHFGAEKKHEEQGSEIKSFGFFANLICDTVTLIRNWKYLLTFGVNQFGSVLFVWTLSQSEVSLAIPITNSLKFLTTYCTGQLLGEQKPSKTAIFGLILIITGIILQIFDKELASQAASN